MHVIGTPFDRLSLTGQRVSTNSTNARASFSGASRHTMQVWETPDFPAEFKGLAKAQVDELAELRLRDDVKWTFLSPAGDFQADGERTGAYILAGEELTLNEAGESVISYADYAIAMADEALEGDHVRQRLSVVRK